MQTHMNSSYSEQGLVRLDLGFGPVPLFWDSFVHFESVVVSSVVSSTAVTYLVSL